MKYWQVSFLLLLLSFITVTWMCFEIGLLESGVLFAGEEKKTENSELKTYPSSEEDVESKHKERDLVLKEKELTDREAMLGEQLKRTDSIISELKQKLSAKEEEIKKVNSDRDSEIKSKLAIKDQEYKSKLAQRDSEIKKLKNQLTQVKDARAENYKSIYEKMDAKKAAKILDEMDLVLSAQIIGDMKQDKAAEILSKMQPEKARLITEKPLKRATASVVTEHSEEVNSSDNQSRGGE